MERIRVALMGLTGIGTEYLSTIRADDRFSLMAVADTDRGRLHETVAGGPARRYDDYRSLIVETARGGLDVLFVALEPFQSTEFVQMAADRGIAVFHRPPLARSTREAGRLIQRFGEAGAPLVVARPWQFEPAFVPALKMVACAERIHVATADVATTDRPEGWRGDAARAGGGVLLHGAYEAVDMLIHLLGLPEVVYARCGAASVSGSARSYDTEDVAIMSLDFGHDRIGGVTARRGAAAEVWRVTLATDDRTFEVRRDGLTVLPHAGGESEHFTVQTDNPADLAIGGFAASWLSGDGKFASTAADHLAVTAVIEAAYLSAKTGAPESPARLLD